VTSEHYRSMMVPKVAGIGGLEWTPAQNARCEAMGGFGASRYLPLTFAAVSRAGSFAPVGMEDPVPPGC